MKADQNKHALKKEKAVKLYREWLDIVHKRWGLGHHKLDKPIQRGWIMQFRVREDILRSSEGRRYLEILPHVQNSYTERSLEELHTYNSKYPLGLRSILEYKREQNIFPEFYWDKYFSKIKDWDDTYKTGVEVKPTVKYVVNRKSVFETYIEKNWRMYVPIIDPEMDSRYHYLSDKLDQENLWTVAYSVMHGQSGMRRERIMCNLKNKLTNNILEHDMFEQLFYAENTNNL